MDEEMGVSMAEGTCEPIPEGMGVLGIRKLV